MRLCSPLSAAVILTLSLVASVASAQYHTRMAVARVTTCVELYALTTLFAPQPNTRAEIRRPVRSSQQSCPGLRKGVN